MYSRSWRRSRAAPPRRVGRLQRYQEMRNDVRIRNMQVLYHSDRMNCVAKHIFQDNAYRNNRYVDVRLSRIRHHGNLGSYNFTRCLPTSSGTSSQSLMVIRPGHVSKQSIQGERRRSRLLCNP